VSALSSRRFVTAMMAASLLAVSACSSSVKDDGPASSSKDDEGSDEKATTKTTRGITDDSITIGGSVYAPYFGDAAIGVEARLKVANDAGGVHGRTIEFAGAEDNNNEPAKDLDIIRRLVEQEEVFAVLPMMSGQPGAADYIVDESIPAFGYGSNPAYCENEVAFGITGCITSPSFTVGSNALGTILVEHFDGDTDKTVAFIGEDNDAARGGIALLTASAEDKGFDVVYGGAVLPAPPEVLGDASPFVTELLSSADGSAPDVIYLQATTSGTKLAAALQAADYEGMIITPSYSPLLLGQDGYNDVYVNTQFGMDPSVAANKEMLAAVAEVDPDAELSLALVAGYWSTDLFLKALEETGEDLTVESFLETLNGGDFTYEMDGAVGPSEWPANHDQVVPCAALTFVENNEFVPSIPLTCGENIEVG
jgi:ABC-type branched-subunit amino acid transport system substrate-binding protein